MRRVVLFACPLLLFLLLDVGVRAAAAPADFVAIEKHIAEEQAKASKAWLDLALDLAAKDLKSEAEDAWKRAQALTPESPALASVEAKIQALTGAATPDAAAMKRIARTRDEVAKCHERMSKVLEKEPQDARFTGFLVTALQLSPTKPRQTTLGTMAQKAPLLVSAEGHPYAGWLSLPKGWKAGAPCSLLLVFEGEGLQFQQALARYVAERKDAPYAVLAPLTFSSGTELKFDRYFPAYPQKLVTEWNGRRGAFDAAGLPGLVEFVRAHFAPGPTTALAALGQGAEPALAYLTSHAASIQAASLALARFDAANLGAAEPGRAPAPPGPMIDVLGAAAGVPDLVAWLAERGLRGATARAAQATGPSELAAQQWAWLTAPR